MVRIFSDFMLISALDTFIRRRAMLGRIVLNRERVLTKVDSFGTTV